MITTVIFDLDGTLLYTLDDLKNSVNFALRMHGLPERTLSEVRKFVGNGVELLIHRAVDGAFSESEEAHCLETFKQHYAKNMNKLTKPYKGILELVSNLLKLNYHIAIVSNKFDSAVKQLNVQYFDGMFPVAIGASDLVAKKPAPDSVYAALSELGVTKDQAVYVGDSEVDVLTAANAGIPCIGVTWGFRDASVLETMGVWRMIDSPWQLLEVLDRRNQAC